jgi:hypothetical protein
MTQADDSQLDLELEDDNALAAIAEIKSEGHAKRRCLRCGGEFVYEDLGTAYVIRCENGDYKLTSRGI